MMGSSPMLLLPCGGRARSFLLVATLAAVISRCTVAVPAEVVVGDFRADRVARLQRRENGDKPEDLACDITDLGSPSTHKHTFSGGYINIHWLGNRDIVVLTYTSSEAVKNNVQYSKDFGVKFNPSKGISEKIHSIVVSPVYDDTISGHWVYALPMDSDSHTLYLSGTHGETFIPKMGVTASTVQPHPVRSNWLLGMGPRSRSFQITGEAETYFIEVSTTDAVEVKSIGSFLSATWQQQEGKLGLYALLKGDETGMFMSSDLISRDYPFEKSTELTILEDCSQLQQSSTLVFGFQYVTDEGTNMFVSQNGFGFEQAKFPIHGKQSQHNIIAANEDAVVVGVDAVLTKQEGDTTISLSTSKNVAFNMSAAKDEWSPVLEEKDEAPLSLIYDKSNPTICTESGGVIVRRIGGKVLLVDRGNCTFMEKIQNAEIAGAAAVIVINNKGDAVFRISDSVTKDNTPGIPAYFIGRSDGELIKAEMAPGTEMFVSVKEENVREKNIDYRSHLYVSGSRGEIFRESLKDVVMSDGWTVNFGAFSFESVDVFNVESLPGTMIANYLTETGAVKSVISQNYGATWKSVTLASECPPIYDSCNLHFALAKSQTENGVPLPYASSTSPGIILANGFYGDQVASSTHSANTYLSTDGGNSWKLILEGPHMYTILGHGDVIVAAVYDAPTTALMYNVDQGKTGFLAAKLDVPTTKEPSVPLDGSSFGHCWTVEISGRTGFNSGVNGIFIRSEEKFAGRPYYVRSPLGDQGNFLYWSDNFKQWQLSRELGMNLDYLHNAGDKPLPTDVFDVWEIYDGYKFVKDPDINVRCGGEGVFIRGISANQDGKTLAAFVHHAEVSRGETTTKGHMIDFTRVFDRHCELSDFDVFPPKDQNCILGSHVQYHRRKPCTMCYTLSSTTYDGLFQRQRLGSCECTPQDWHCAFGFIREGGNLDNPNGNCIVDRSFATDLCEIMEEGKYVGHVYELASGDDCTPQDGSKFTQTAATKCTKDANGKLTPSTSSKGMDGPSSSDGAPVALIVILVLFSVLGLSGAVVLWVSPSARRATIRRCGIEEGLGGVCGRFLARFNCFRTTTTFKYSQLYDGVSSEGEISDDDDDLLG